MMPRITGGIAALALAACVAPPRPTDVASLSGVDMFQQLCASCHGVDGRGGGPVAPLIKTHVPDLTRIAYRDGGEFPLEDVRRTIDGRYERPAHGPRDMPVWGWQFYRSTSPDDAAERARTDAQIDKLVDYLRLIQKE